MSITIDGNKVERIEFLVNKGHFRNKSHFIEFAVDKLLGDKNE